MNSIQIADETFVCADPVEVGAAVADPANWRRWWPDLRLTVVEDRGPIGHRWTVTGALTGTMEVWLQPGRDGMGAVQDGPGQGEPQAPGGWQEHGLRGEAETGGNPPGRGLPGGLTTC